jgi:hypothetical protein
VRGRRQGCPVHQSLWEVNMFVEKYENLWPGDGNPRCIPQDEAYLRTVQLKRYGL